MAAQTATILIIGPLKTLHAEQVRRLRRLGIKAVALNEDTLRRKQVSPTFGPVQRAAADNLMYLGATFLGQVKKKRRRSDALGAAVAGKILVVIASPETLLRNHRVGKQLYTSKWAKSLAAIYVDEAHVAYDWGFVSKRQGQDAQVQQPFRPEYGKIGAIRARFGAGVPLIAVTATLPANILPEVFRLLEFGRLPFFALDVGIEREQTSYEIEPMRHPARTYADLVELFPSSASTPSHIPRTLVYVNTRKEASGAAAAIRRGISPACRGAVTSITALSTAAHKSNTLKHDFSNGDVRILVATEAVGMGVDLPAIDMVVQWRLPRDFKGLVQHFGRGSRRDGQRTRAVLMIDKKRLHRLRPSSSPSSASPVPPTAPTPPALAASRVATGSSASRLTQKNTAKASELPHLVPTLDKDAGLDPLLRTWIGSKTCLRCLLRLMLLLDFDTLRVLLGRPVAVTSSTIGLGPIPLEQTASDDLPRTYQRAIPELASS
ncbi:hypothetical protein OC834_001644 [Tilletia horrida]|nr:hypothetical protein OC834_001644 [Tilletia horrida]